MENGWIKERLGDMEHFKTYDTFHTKYIQKPLASSNTESIAQMKFTGKSGFLISALASPLSSFSFSIYPSTPWFSFTLLFHFLKDLPESSRPFSAHLCLYKTQHLLNVNKYTREWRKRERNDCMHEPEAMRARADVNIQLYVGSSFFFIYAFRSVNVYNLKARQH